MDLAAVEDQIRNVDFVAEVEAGTASVEQIAAVVAEEYSIIRSDLNSFTQMADRWDSPQGSHFFGDLAFGEALALPLVLDFAANVGLSEADLAAYEPRPKGQTYPSRVAWIASNADRASAAASFLVNFGVFGENMARVRDALLECTGSRPRKWSSSRSSPSRSPASRTMPSRSSRRGCRRAPARGTCGGRPAAPGLRAGFLAGGLRSPRLAAARELDSQLTGFREGWRAR